MQILEGCNICKQAETRGGVKTAEMECPVSLGERLQGALSGCPFLRSVAAERGSFAAALTACSAGPVLEERLDSLANTYSLFHASSGCPVPLADRATGVCPFAGRRSASSRLESVAGASGRVGDDEPRRGPLAAATGLPLGSISIPLLGFLVRLGRHRCGLPRGLLEPMFLMYLRATV